MGLQSPDGLCTRVLFLNVLRSEQDRMAGIEMPASLARFLSLLRPLEVM